MIRCHLTDNIVNSRKVMDDFDDYSHALIEKLEYIQSEVLSLRNNTNTTYNQYVERYIKYSEKLKEDLEKWKENEISYVEDERDRSISCCNSDFDIYLSQIDSRYKIYLKFKVEALKTYFPEQFEYFSKYGLDILHELSEIPSVTNERAPTNSIQFSDQPFLSKEEINSDINSLHYIVKPVVKQDSIVIGSNIYKIGEKMPIPSIPGSYLQLLFTHPNISVVIDGESFDITIERFVRLVS